MSIFYFIDLGAKMVEGCWYIGVYQHGRENCNNTKLDGRVFNSATDEKITGSNSKDIFRK